MDMYILKFLYHNLGPAVRKIAHIQNAHPYTDTDTKTHEKAWAAT